MECVVLNRAVSGRRGRKTRVSDNSGEWRRSRARRREKDRAAAELPGGYLLRFQELLELHMKALQSDVAQLEPGLTGPMLDELVVRVTVRDEKGGRTCQSFSWAMEDDLETESEDGMAGMEASPAEELVSAASSQEDEVMECDGDSLGMALPHRVPAPQDCDEGNVPTSLLKNGDRHLANVEVSQCWNYLSEPVPDFQQAVSGEESGGTVEVERDEPGHRSLWSASAGWLAMACVMWVVLQGYASGAELRIAGGAAPISAVVWAGWKWRAAARRIFGRIFGSGVRLSGSR